MLIKTKKVKLSMRKYILLAMKNILQEQWWISIVVVVLSSGSLIFRTHWFWICTLIALVGYIGFWILQFFAVTQIEQNKIILESLFYEINSQKILMKINHKQGMPIVWSQIKKGYQGKNYFLLILSKAHIIYLPYKIFSSDLEVKFFASLLKKKKIDQKIWL